MNHIFAFLVFSFFFWLFFANKKKGYYPSAKQRNYKLRFLKPSNFGVFQLLEARKKIV
jgi:hypothetical protein